MTPDLYMCMKVVEGHLVLKIVYLLVMSMETV
jgi:hypothetical protein